MPTRSIFVDSLGGSKGHSRKPHLRLHALTAASDVLGLSAS